MPAKTQAAPDAGAATQDAVSAGACFDVFNGDADGICALQQLRLDEPRAAELVTGVKRDNGLLARVNAGAGDEITVLDVSMKSNAAALAELLARGVRCRYFDHHAPGEIPQHPNLFVSIETDPDLCTSLLVDRHIAGRQRLWAVVGAFGDNLVAAALRAAQPLALDHLDLARLHELGECINYNAYGDSVDDLHYHPADLYRALAPYADPRQFIQDEPVLDVLRQAYAEDLERAGAVRAEFATAGAALFILPDAAWSRRVNGIFSNRLAQAHPARAHAVLVARQRHYSVSVRAPVAVPEGAERLCAQFGGGGRRGAAGINHLPQAELPFFAAALRDRYPG